MRYSVLRCLNARLNSVMRLGGVTFDIESRNWLLGFVSDEADGGRIDDKWGRGWDRRGWNYVNLVSIQVINTTQYTGPCVVVAYSSRVVYVSLASFM